MKFWLVIVLFFSLGARDFDHLDEHVQVDRTLRPPQLAPPEGPPHIPPETDAAGPMPTTNVPQAGPLPGEIPPNGPDGLSPLDYPQDKMPPTKLPTQGTLPKIYKRKPKELQDEGNFMSHPMPQRNPGPSSVFPLRPHSYTPHRSKDLPTRKFPFQDQRKQP